MKKHLERPIVRPVRHVIDERTRWTPTFFDTLRAVDEIMMDAVGELLTAVTKARTSHASRIP